MVELYMIDQLQHHNEKAIGVALTRKQLIAHFKKYDNNKDNLLTKAELKEALKELGLGWLPTHYRAWRCFQEADANGDGLISEDELDDLVDYVHSKGYKMH